MIVYFQKTNKGKRTSDKIYYRDLKIKKRINQTVDSLSLSGYQDSNLGPPAPKAREQGLYLTNY